MDAEAPSQCLHFTREGACVDLVTRWMWEEAWMSITNTRGKMFNLGDGLFISYRVMLLVLAGPLCGEACTGTHYSQEVAN